MNQREKDISHTESLFIQSIRSSNDHASLYDNYYRALIEVVATHAPHVFKELNKEKWNKRISLSKSKDSIISLLQDPYDDIMNDQYVEYCSNQKGIK